MDVRAGYTVSDDDDDDDDDGDDDDDDDDDTDGVKRTWNQKSPKDADAVMRETIRQNTWSMYACVLYLPYEWKRLRNDEELLESNIFFCCCC